MIKIAGFAPDADPTTPGVLLDAENIIPTLSGIGGAPVAISVGADALDAACRGAASVSNLAGTVRFFAGTSAKLQELSGTTWTNRSRAGAPAYSLGADDRWSFAQFASATLAATPTAILQRSTTGAFSDVSGAPTAKLVETAQGFAVCFNTTSYTDEWYCSAYLDETNWTLSVANQCVSGRLIGGSGGILAAKRFGDDIIAYKQGAMFRGTYVGAPEVWRWTQVSTDVGCVGQEAVVDTSAGHIFIGKDNLYLYDGTTPRPLGVGVIRDWLMADMAGSYQFKASLLWDRANSQVRVNYVRANTSGALNRCVIYDVRTGRFGVAHATIEATASYQSSGATYTSGIPGVTTYTSGPEIPYDSLYWITGTTAPAVFNSSHVLSTLSGSCTSASFTTGDMGAEDGYLLCRNFRVRYSQAPTTSTATGYTKDQSGVTVAVGTSGSQSDGRHNMRQMARWHRFKVETTGDFEATAMQPEFVAGGTR